jgi:hypothetical protein
MASRRHERDPLSVRGQSRIGSTMSLLAASAGLAAGVYALYAGVTWWRYDHTARASADGRDALLDRFMPRYEVVERHHMSVAAPADVTFAAACEQDLFALPLVRLIVRAREIALGAAPADRRQPPGLIAAMRSLGWGELAAVAGREIVMGAVTKPWEANVTFHAVPPDEFASFAEPGFVKIAWTLRADPSGESAAIFRTETRAIATDPAARARFRRYWAFVSPGVALIRRLSLRPLRRTAEGRARTLRHVRG